MLKKKHIISIALLLAFICPAQANARENFWGDTVDYEIHDLQPPSATQFGENTPVTTSASVSTTEVGSRKIKNVEILGNNIIDTSVILEQINIQEGDTYSRDTVQQALKAIYHLGYFTEKMKAVPVNNSDGTVTLKIILEEILISLFVNYMAN